MKMKFISSLSAMTLLAISASAHAGNQYKKGTWDLGLSYDATTASLLPGIGYYMIDNLEGTFQFDWSSIKTDISNSGGTTKNDALGFELGALYDFNNAGPVVPKVGLEALYNYSRTRTNGANTTKTNTAGIGFLAGLNFDVNDKSTVGVSVSYVAAHSNDDVSTKSADISGYDLSFDYNLYFF